MKECPACKRCFPDDINHCPQDGEATLPSLLGEPILDARYQLEQRLGQGGMGVVFKARHIFLKTQHAIKIILPDLVGNDPNLVTRFRQEALAAAAIRHPNIIAVTDFGVVRGTMPFLVMEFVKGRSLQEIMAEEGKMSSARAYELIGPAASGIAAAHRQNIVHRDLKPLNIMLQEGMPPNEGLKILDFGLAKIKSGELLGSFVQAKTSGLMGSPFYMAPEQWSDEEPDARADIYSLGVILYQMLAGDVPFKGSSIPSIMKKHLTLPPASFQSIGISVPPLVEAVVRHALEKEPDARTASVDEFLNELKYAVGGVSIPPRPVRDTQSVIDPNRTIVAQPSAGNTTSVASPTGFETNFDPHAGTISSQSLDEQMKEQLAASSAQIRLEQEAKERYARDELAREAEARRVAAEEAARKKKEEEDRIRREQEERQAKERQHSEQIERVFKQAEQLEEKLARLTTVIPAQTTLGGDPAQAYQQSIGAQTGVANSFPGGQTFPPTFPGAQPSSKKTPVILISVILLLFLIGGGAVVGYFVWQSRRVVTGPGSASPTPTPIAQVKPELIEIPGGTFQMGRMATVSEFPVHAVTVRTFSIDKTEVTNTEYAQFVSETKYESPSNWISGKPIPGQELLPVTFVSHDDAVAFADWRSKRDNAQYRLPTEEEWEYAARGGDEDRVYPWGNTWVEDYAVTKNSGATMPKPVGSSPNDKTRWNVMDMMGNVYEWTATKATYYPGSEGKVEGEQRGWYVIRGASYATEQTPKPISTTRRDWISGNTKVSVLGFRLVRAQ